MNNEPLASQPEKGTIHLPVIHVVGVGITGADSLSADTRDLVEKATILVGGQRHLAAFDYLLAPPSLIEGWPLGDFDQTFEKMRSRCQSHPDTRMVVLTSGDPLFFGLGRLLLANFPAKQLAFHPHVSAMQLAFSRIKLPWQEATLISLHGRSETLLAEAIRRGDRKIALLTDNVMTPRAIAKLIVSLEIPVRYTIWVCENLGAKDEKVASYSLEEIQSQEFAALNVVVLHKQIADDASAGDHLPASLPLIGLPDSAFYGFPDRPALMTKKEVRLMILGELAPLADDIIWDIGAGTGSVSVELSRLCPQSRLYAIEKTAAGAALIQKNAQRLAIAPIEIVRGSAPEVLAGLPSPDRVFIGGSGGQLLSILNLLSKIFADKTDRQPLVVVIAFATVEHLSQAIAWLNQSDITPCWTYRLTQINVSRSMSVGSLTRLSPLNPVTLLTLQAVG